MDSLEIILENSLKSYTQEEKETMAWEKNVRYRQLLAKMAPQDLAPEMKNILDTLRKKGIKLAVGSSSKNTPFILERLGLAHFFDAVVDGNQIVHSKPHPEVFLKAAEALALPPAACLVLEDAASGIKAAHQGGMDAACVGDAARMQAGDYNLERLTQLLDIFV